MIPKWYQSQLGISDIRLGYLTSVRNRHLKLVNNTHVWTVVVFILKKIKKNISFPIKFPCCLWLEPRT
jgi:hypothetical protein